MSIAAPPAPRTGSDVVVVGVDGSAASMAALDWAVAEASRDARALHVVVAHERPPWAPYAPPARDEPPEELKLNELVETVRPHLRKARADLVVRKGRLEQVLLWESADAGLLVVGREAASPEIGPLARTCVANAHCPVVVVTREG
jgi:nucleotide-binding universal stress UspA family protein